MRRASPTSVPTTSAACASWRGCCRSSWSSRGAGQPRRASPDPHANRYARYLQSLQLPLSSPGAVVLVNGRADPDLGPVHGVSELLTATFNAAPEAARRALAAARPGSAATLCRPTGLFNTARSVIADRLRPR